MASSIETTSEVKLLKINSDSKISEAKPRKGGIFRCGKKTNNHEMIVCLGSFETLGSKLRQGTLEEVSAVRTT